MEDKGFENNNEYLAKGSLTAISKGVSAIACALKSCKNAKSLYFGQNL